VGQDFNSLVAEGLQVIDAVEQKKAILRLMGGVGIRIHTVTYPDLFERLNRAPGDLDFMGLKKQSWTVKETMKSLGYEPNQQVNAYHGHKRQIWYSPRNQIDILFDVFEMCHVIDLRDRLHVDRPTLSPSDLFLQKIQIVQINEKDIKDLIILLVEHDLGEEDGDRINLKYVSQILSDDWGFWYTTTLNLDKLEHMLDNYPQLTADEKRKVKERVQAIRERLISSPKSFKWRLRERIGTKTQWYNVVEEVIR
jgi:hypothetical protein